ncbi:MAG: glycosyl transferase family 2 [Chitinophagaceae bacterium]|nr:glycosyl transferase family 2 [Chitinophagaceae bacterium]
MGRKLKLLKPKTSLIISTYNKPAVLRLCLESVKAQSVLPDEIIIADDGSSEDTRELINQYAAAFSIEVKHIWQPDEGYHLPRIQNKALAAAKYEYIIQIDGDLILHSRFVEDHLSICRRNTFISGARALLDEQTTHELITLAGSSPQIKAFRVGKKYNAIHSRILSALNYLLQRGSRQVNYVLGCNMAFWKDDLIKINGHNEEFIDWGKEDNDISMRLINAGVKLRFLKFGGIVYHLFHNERPMEGTSNNERLFNESRNKKITFVPKGMNQHRYP